MKWGAWHRTSPTSMKPLATCDAETHEEAVAILEPKCPVADVKVEPLAEQGKSHVGRYYTQTGPVLTEEDLRR